MFCSAKIQDVVRRIRLHLYKSAGRNSHPKILEFSSQGMLHMEDTITYESQQIRAFTSPSNHTINKIGRLSPRILHAVCLTIIEPQAGRKEKEHKREKETERKKGK